MENLVAADINLTFGVHGKDGVVVRLLGIVFYESRTTELEQVLLLQMRRMSRGQRTARRGAEVKIETHLDQLGQDLLDQHRLSLELFDPRHLALQVLEIPLDDLAPGQSSVRLPLDIRKHVDDLLHDEHVLVVGDGDLGLLGRLRNGSGGLGGGSVVLLLLVFGDGFGATRG